MKHSDTYNTIAHPAEGLYKDKGSKFIALAWPVRHEDQIKETLEEVRKKYYDARHHCYAWALDQNRERFRMNDDGEPSGTAGKPIFGQILSHDLTNILIVVIRYFGGVKLGVRGLINAYKGAAADALHNAHITGMIIYDHFEVSFEYPVMNEVMKIMKDYELQQLEHDFQMKCRLVFAVRRDLSEKIKGLFEKNPLVSIKQVS